MAVILGVDGVEEGAHALEWSLDEARRRRTRLLVVHAWTAPRPPHRLTSEVLERLARAARERLDQVVATACAMAPDVEVLGRSIPHAPAFALASVASATDLVVVGPHGRSSVGRLLFGSVADAVLRASTAPVAFLRPMAVEHAGAVVVGIDGSPASSAALRVGALEAEMRTAALVALHAWLPQLNEFGVTGPADEDWEADARAIVARAIEHASIERDPVVELVRCDASNALLEASSGAAVVVVGSRGLGPLSGVLLGSVSRRLVHSGACPVIVVPGGMT